MNGTIDYNAVFGVDTSTDADTGGADVAGVAGEAGANLSGNSTGSDGVDSGAEAATESPENVPQTPPDTEGDTGTPSQAGEATGVVPGGNPGNPDATGGDSQAGTQNPRVAGQGPDPAAVAAQRRAAAEQAAAMARYRAQAQAEAARTVDQVIADAGMTNPYTGKPITSKAEYDDYKRRYDAERRQNILEQTGMSDEEFQRYVQSLPEVRQAREQSAAAAATLRQAQARERQAQINADLQAIHEMDPSIRSVADLAKMDSYDTLYKLIQTNAHLSLVDAFKLANYDKLTRAAADGARQQAMNNLQSKSHLEPARSRGGRDAGVPVPADVRELYQALIPGATDAEIRAHYNRYHSN